LKSLNDSICLRRLYVFSVLIRRFESSKIWYRSSKISFEMIYNLIEFLKNRKIKCFIASSSILIRTYVFCCTSMKNQFVIFFNLLRIANNQSSMTRFLSSIKTDESSNFLNVAVETITSSSMINKKYLNFLSSFLVISLWVLEWSTWRHSTRQYNRCIQFQNSSSHLSFYWIRW
jgi:hypothetical protein